MTKKSTPPVKKPIGKFTYEIGGILYKVNLYDPKIFDLKHPDCDACVMKQYNPYFEFSTANLSINIVRHELMHAYIHNTHCGENDIDVEHFEEIICEIMAHSADRYIKDSNAIYKQLLSIKDDYERQRQFKDSKRDGSSKSS